MTTSAPADRVTRDAAAVSSWNLASRLTGVLRVVVLGGALGATRLGDTYQGSNQVSNVLFELLAAGTLSAILVPGLVARLSGPDVEDARAFAGAVLGRALVLLTPLALLAMVLARPLASVLFAGNSGDSHAAQVRLAAFLLLFVLPQVLLYAWGAVVTAVLHAAGRFVAASVAPIANNLLVSAGLGLFWYRGASGIGIVGFDRWLLGGTALGGVLAMTAVPSIAAWRAGLGVVPRFGPRALVSGVGRDAMWGSVALLPAQLVAFGSLLVAGRVSGGVAAYQIAFTFFLLPHALVGHPTATVLFPRLARVASSDPVRLRLVAGSGLDLMAALLCASASLVIALAPWLVRVVAVGALDDVAGRSLTATVLAWLALGLPAYGVVLLLTRVSYAALDVTTPAWSAVLGAVVAFAVLVVATIPDSDSVTVAVVAMAHTAMVTVTAAALLVRVVRKRWIELHAVALGRYVVAAAGGGVAARLGSGLAPSDPGRFGAIVTVAAASLLGVAAFGAVAAVLGQRSLPRLVDAT